jgi:hypothetical protein
MRPQIGTTIRLILAPAFATILAAAIAPSPARAGFVVTVQPATATAGSTNDTLQVTLTNTGNSAVTVGGFAFEIVAGSGVTFTSVDTSTTPAYIFAGHSAFGPDISNPPPTLPGNMLAAEDNYFNSGGGTQGISLGAGMTVGLGDVHFNVSPTATGPITITLDGFPTTNFEDASGNDITQSVGTTVNNGTVTVTPAAVPEPSSLAMTALALAIGLGLGHRRLIRRAA